MSAALLLFRRVVLLRLGRVARGWRSAFGSPSAGDAGVGLLPPRLGRLSHGRAILLEGRELCTQGPASGPCLPIPMRRRGGR